MSPSSPDSPTGGRVLVLARHGKADAYSAEDHRRQLTERGRRESTESGRWLAEEGFLPTHAIVSSAARTRQSWDCLVAGSGCEAEVEFVEAAYGADTDGALELLRHAPAEAQVLALVGHNPTLSSLTHLLDGGDPDATAFRMLSFGLPTSGVAVLAVDVPWARLDAGTARLVAGHTPQWSVERLTAGVRGRQVVALTALAWREALRRTRVRA